MANAYTANAIAQEMRHLKGLRQHRRIALELNNIDDEESVSKFIRSVVFQALPQVVPLILYKCVTDPRDKVFTLLNITSDNLDKDLSLKIASIINYDLSIQDVYIRTYEIWHAGATSKFNAIGLKITLV